MASLLESKGSSKREDMTKKRSPKRGSKAKTKGTQEGPFICHKCTKEYKTHRGLINHLNWGDQSELACAKYQRRLAKEAWLKSLEWQTLNELAAIMHDFKPRLTFEEYWIDPQHDCGKLTITIRSYTFTATIDGAVAHFFSDASFVAWMDKAAECITLPLADPDFFNKAKNIMLNMVKKKLERTIRSNKRCIEQTRATLDKVKSIMAEKCDHLNI